MAKKSKISKNIPDVEIIEGQKAGPNIGIAFFGGDETEDEKPKLTLAHYEDLPQRIKSGTFPDLSKYTNILSVRTPYSTYGSYINISDTVELCRKAYFAFPLLRAVIETMVEFCNGDLYLEGGNKKVRDFFYVWFDKIKQWSFADRFYRELLRGANDFIYRTDGEFDEESIKELSKVYGAELNKKKIPVRYTIFDAATIRVGQDITFEEPLYVKVFSNYELQRLRNQKDVEDLEVFKSLTPEERKQVKSGTSPYLKLNPDRLYAVFYKKQDYEPFAVPFFYGALDLLETKLALQAMDRALAKTADWAILHLRIGDEKTGLINPNTIGHLQNIFKNESTRRVLVTDYTVIGAWLIPNIADIMGPSKYEA
ncbi:MAG: hypothetical protein AABY22_33725, partial [Nanoarchaeota archaeon]